MKTMFNFTPKGIPPQWPKGKHHDFTVALTAEKICLSCHIDAKLGEELGHVTVRKYLSTKIDHWWEEVRLTSIMGLLNIFIHTIVLLLILKIRMEPLTNLHSTVSTLAKGIINLSYRATIKTHDEFGELALDLNHFLDRISHIIDDLRQVVSKVVEANHHLSPIRNQISEQLETIHQQSQAVVKYSFEGRKAHPVFSQESIENIDVVLATLELLSKEGKISEESAFKAGQVLSQFKTTIGQAQETFQQFDQLGEKLVELSGDIHGLAYIIGEMAVLEEKMQAVAEAGQVLLKRLSEEQD